MRDKTIDLNAQAGSGVRTICDAIEGLKAWKREYKKQTGMDLDISGDLKAIRSNLNDLLVEWHKYCFSFKAVTETNFLRARDINQWFENEEIPPEIVGNVYNNPELAEVGD